MMCDPCMGALMGIGAACGENFCSEDGPCAYAKEMLLQSCGPDFVLPSDEDDEDDEDDEELTVGQFLSMCSGCMGSLVSYGAVCSEEAGRDKEFCEDNSECHSLFWELQTECRPEGHGENLPHCLRDEDSCECKSLNVTYCLSDGMSECSDICQNYENPACEDEGSCGCMMSMDEDMCETCEETGCRGCKEECDLKNMADFMFIMQLM